MTRILFIFIFLIIFQGLQSQILDPVSWSTKSNQLSDTEWELIYTADIEAGWYVYSQYLEEGGPIPTTIQYNSESDFTISGKAEEFGKITTGHDDMFDMDITKFSQSMQIVQKVSVDASITQITGQLEYMTCDNARCLPPALVDFKFDLSSSKTMLDLEVPTEGSTEPNDQIHEPAKWSGSNIEKLANNQYKINISAEIESGWYIYSRTMKEDAGPLPIIITYNNDQVVVDQREENGPHIKTEHDQIFETEVIKVFDNVTLTDVISVPPNLNQLSGTIEYMSCSNTECVFPAPISFTVDFKNGILLIDSDDDTNQTANLIPGSNQKLKDYYDLDPTLMDQTLVENCSIDVAASQAPLSQSGNGKIFFLGFIGGLIALLTPCVFPMIPLTVSFFTKTNKSKSAGIQRAVLYGGFIFAIYLLLSLPFHFIDSINPDILNNISTNVYLNISFFAVFILFAFSFFGYYELTLPSSWSNKVSQAEGIGGTIGVFFMALTLALVSFSCTGPILGSLLAGSLSSNGGAMQLTAGMSGFGLALALPFGLFAAFPTVMQKLPKSGSWMNTVKVIMGFLELALAFKFLSNADLVEHWGLLKIEPFLIIWILIAIGLALYLFGAFRFPHDSKMDKVNNTRKLLGGLSVVIALYLISGFRFNDKTQTFTPLKLLSGIAPPVGYSWLHPNECPNNINCFKDLNTGMAYAKANNLPVMLDFTGYACVNCRKMEEHVWPDPQITNLLEREYVLISLYVDDRTPLSESEAVQLPKHNGGERSLKTVGDKWQFFQTEYFKNNSQPYYVLIDSEGQLLNKPVGYTPEVEDFKSFLECGLQKHHGIIPALGLR